MISVGEAAPDFLLRDQAGYKTSLADLAGSKAMIIFMPYAFTSTCESEMCALRDNLHHVEASGTKSFVITCDSRHSNRRWAEDQGFQFPILSDFWPHGNVSRAYGAVIEKLGVPMRATFVLDESAVVTEVIATEQLDIPRDFSEYERALR